MSDYEDNEDENEKKKKKKPYSPYIDPDRLMEKATVDASEQSDNPYIDPDKPMEKATIDPNDQFNPLHYDPNRPTEKKILQANPDDMPNFNSYLPIEKHTIQGYGSHSNHTPIRKSRSSMGQGISRPNNSIVRDLNAGLTTYDKGKLYIEIVDYLENLVDTFELDVVESIVLNDFTTTDILTKVFIYPIDRNSDTFRQTRHRLIFVFFALYTTKSYGDLVNQFESVVNENREKIISDLEEMQEELKQTKNNDLNTHWINKMAEEIAKTIKKNKEKVKIGNNNDSDVDVKKPEVKKEELKEEDVKEEAKLKIPTSLMINDYTQKELQDIIFEHENNSQLGILAIYYICETFSRKNDIDKKFFSGNELNYLLDKHSQFFYGIRDNLINDNLIEYYCIFPRRAKVNEKVYVITKKGYDSATNIINSKKREFPNLYNKLLSILERRYTEHNKELINSENKNKIFYYFNDSLEQSIVCIYFICEKFPQSFSIIKNYFSKDEFNYIINRETKFFSNIKDSLKKNNLIQYYGLFSKRSKSYEKVYTITDEGISLSKELIDFKTKSFPNLSDKLLSIFEKRYIEFNKDLIESNNEEYVIHSKEEISNDLEDLAEKNNIEILSSFESENKEISFKCKICNKTFKDAYRKIKKREPPKLFCLYCYPELKIGIYVQRELKERIAISLLNELKKLSLILLSEKKILENINRINEIVYDSIYPLILEKKTEFKEYIKKYISAICHFLARIKFLSETNQKVSINKVAKETHKEDFISLTHWKKLTKDIIKYLREEHGFDIRTKLHDTLSQDFQNSVRIHKTLFKLINNRTIVYLAIDYVTEIIIYYDGKCQGINGHCPFDIDYRFLPSFSFHHLLKNYKKIVTRKGFEYMLPSDITAFTFDKALELMKTQIGGLKLNCINCHSFEHDTIYCFSSIFSFLHSLNLEYINNNPSKILNKVKMLVDEYYLQKKENYSISEKVSKAQRRAEIKYNIKIQILKFVKKKYAIEFLFGKNYVCPICQKANINNHLNCFQAHHTNKDLFKNALKKIAFSEEFKKKPIDWLIENLIMQECIYICGNCHRMLHSKYYRDSVLIVLKNKDDERFIDNFYKNLYDKLKELRNKILEWKAKLIDDSLYYYKFPSLK